jgi:signal transduction histidine kinase
MAQHEPVELLIVDDKLDNLVALEAILDEPGQRVVRASSGRDALRHLLRQEFAVILLDINMPGMDGFETAQLIRQHRSAKHTPIIFLTAFGEDMYLERSYSLGAVDYIMTPVVPEVLRSKVAVFVDLFRKTAEVRRQATALQQRAAQLHKLTAAALAINAALSIDAMLRAITDAARDIVGAHHASALVALGHPGERPRTASSSSAEHAASREGRAARKPQPEPVDTAVHELLLQRSAPIRKTRRELDADPAFFHVGRGSAVAVAGHAGRGSALAVAGHAGRGSALAVAGHAGRDSAFAAPSGGLDPKPAWGGLLAAPLLEADGSNMGFIELVHKIEGDFDEDDEAVLMQLAQMGSIAIQNCVNAEAREANRLKDEFLATLSHELRTPLNAIMGWTRLLRTGPPDDTKLSRGLEVIERNVNAQARMIEDLLDVSRITTGKMRLNTRPVELAPVVEAVLETLRPAAEAKEISVAASVDGRAGQVQADPERIQQVISNLIGNAIKFTPKGGHINVHLGRVEGDVELRIADSGEGISPEFLPFVFERFRQADSTVRRVQGGLGIGLAIVRHIVELHGGAVSAQSPGRGRGSSFIVRLPAALATQRRPSVPPPKAAPSPRGGPAVGVVGGAVGEPGREGFDALEGLRVLLVEDDPDAREMVMEVLLLHRAEVTAVGSVREALEVFSSVRPHVLVSDVAMPLEDGYDLIRRVRELGPEQGGDVPALALTAHARREDHARAIAAGFQMHAAKPIDPDELVSAVGRLAGKPSALSPGHLPRIPGPEADALGAREAR